MLCVCGCQCGIVDDDVCFVLGVLIEVVDWLQCDVGCVGLCDLGCVVEVGWQLQYEMKVCVFVGYCVLVVGMFG